MFWLRPSPPLIEFFALSTFFAVGFGFDFGVAALVSGVGFIFPSPFKETGRDGRLPRNRPFARLLVKLLRRMVIGVCLASSGII